MPDTAHKWSGGGWFGAQIGSTCWMLVAAALLAPGGFGVAAATLGIFGVTNAIGTFLWMQRDRLPPMRALQTLVVLAGTASALATYVIDAAGRFETLGVGGQVSARSMYITLAVLVPALLVLFHLVDRQGAPRP